VPTASFIRLAGLGTYAASLVILNRWPVTARGLRSFGMVWQYYVSWADVGFVRRGLLGTILSATGVNRLAADAYVFAYLFYAAKLALLTALVTEFLARRRPFESRAAYLAVLLSPALILQASYGSGSLDLVLLLLAACLVLRPPPEAVAIPLAVAGVLVHELFAFVLPFLAVLRFLETGGSRAAALRMAVPSLLAVALVVGFGALRMAEEPFEAHMAQTLPAAAHQHTLWSGYFELSSGIAANMARGLGVLPLLWRRPYLPLVPAIYALLLAALVFRHAEGPARRHRAWLVATLLAPWLVIVLASDLYRWLALSANLSLLAMMRLSATGALHIPPGRFRWLLPFTLLAPFGKAGLERPFPAHQLLIEALFG
jgi:hypothetical protein